MPSRYEACEYTIPNSNLKDWRVSTDYEIKEYLKTIAAHGLKWDADIYQFSQINGDASNDIDPILFYKEWNQAHPLTIMDDDRRETIINLLKKC